MPEEVCPGDVVQFTSVKLEKPGSRQILGMPNHTAIVGRVMSPGVYLILHQNTGSGGKTVSQSTIDLSTKTEGKIEIYRPIPKRPEKVEKRQEGWIPNHFHLVLWPHEDGDLSRSHAVAFDFSRLSSVYCPYALTDGPRASRI
ncbi:MAG: hypothetical protein ACLQNE_46290 [Thermoguttaceae bacterium]|jgi:hypothetical protein